LHANIEQLGSIFCGINTWESQRDLPANVRHK
jgi:hypothetical protein